MRFGALLAVILTAALGPGRRPAAAGEAEDPYLWLEEVDSPKALDWVRERNAESLGGLEADPRYAPLKADILRVLTAQDRIPFPGLGGGWIFNFWQDAEHKQGLWRRARPEEYAKAGPAWEALLDLDALSAQEGKTWVWHGAQCLPPKRERCLVELSSGGSDAAVVREFDVPSRSFVEGGFALPEAKSKVGWIKEDEIFTGTDFGPGSMTRSGYPRLVKRWRRGTPLAEAVLVFECREEDVSCWGRTQFRPEGALSSLHRAVNFYESESFILSPGGKLRRVPLPASSEFKGVFQGFWLASLREPWAAPKASFPAGALIALPLSALDAERPEAAAELLWAPDAASSLDSVAIARDAVYLDVLRNVSGGVLRATRGEGWKVEALPVPEKGMARVVEAEDDEETFVLLYESFLTPSTLSLWAPGREKALPEPAKRLPERFDARGMRVEQRSAASRDGTRVPYFLVYREPLKADGERPTLLYGYGGFEYAMTPSYLQTLGKAWLEKGGVYALANIRGGGEFGPAWHKAALKGKRQKAFDDFIAVAEDLRREGVTSPRRLGIMGGSNGGLLVGSVFVQRPELFNAVVCQVPLLDMLRYHKLLAGPNWMAEYGDPEKPEEAAALRAYSPYQNVKKGARYPKVFFATSTKDDRVHPGHARKMVARMLEQGHEALYFENIEGGHGAAANLEQRARRNALEYVYLYQRLMD